MTTKPILVSAVALPLSMLAAVTKLAGVPMVVCLSAIRVASRCGVVRAEERREGYGRLPVLPVACTVSVGRRMAEPVPL